MKILAIETSCDETGLALIETSGKNQIKILANLVSSQIEIHRSYGGVVPNLAKREHEKALPLLWQKLQETSDQRQVNFNLIAVTKGPGLAPCLWTGINFAKDLAKSLKKPLVGINHLKGHIFSAMMTKNPKSQKPNLQPLIYNLSPIIFPALTLIVSGGHTQLVYSPKLGQYKIVGETLDDAAGEAFDKVARLLGLGYPGGPEISALAETAKFKYLNMEILKKIKLPRPMINSKNHDFSFSGLKTAVLYLLRDLKAAGKDIEKLKPFIAKEFQDAVVEVLIKKTVAAAKSLTPKSQTLILGGGVAANEKLRKELGKSLENKLPAITYSLPPTFLTGDNALMIALAALAEIKILKPVKNLEDLEADANLRLPTKSY